MGWKKRNLLKLFTASKADRPSVISPGCESPQLSSHPRHKPSTPNEATTAQSSRFSQNLRPLFAQYTPMHLSRLEPVESTSRTNLEGRTSQDDCMVCTGEHYSVIFCAQQAPHNTFRLIIPCGCYMKMMNLWSEQRRLLDESKLRNDYELCARRSLMRRGTYNLSTETWILYHVSPCTYPQTGSLTRQTSSFTSLMVLVTLSPPMDLTSPWLVSPQEEPRTLLIMRSPGCIGIRSCLWEFRLTFLFDVSEL